MIEYFIVASRGCTAGTWLAEALNKHPDIFCCHGRDRPGRGRETPELLVNEAYRVDRLAFEQEQRGMELRDYLGLVKAASNGAAVVGNVHGFILPELLDKMGKAEFRFPIGNITRHPVNFVEDYTEKVLRRRVDYPEKFAKEHLSRVQENIEAARGFGMAPFPHYLGFIEACQMAAKMSRDLETEGVHHFLMECIIGDQGYFSIAASLLTGCSFLTAIHPLARQEIVNLHSKRSLLLPAEIWKQWSASQRLLFRNLVPLDQFRAIGYDIPS